MPTSTSPGQQAFGDIAPKFAQLTDEVLFGDIWQRPGLAPRERSIATVAALIALNRTEQLPFHLKRAQDNGVSRDELAELITHLAFYAGWPVAASAITALRALDTAKE
ncbi:carboxymuconolactone decarboxylase family protein [Dyella subtropica]|uniref:carboxymuconolactone decarboxylase family protein n=1 Tax=Dyella subtropica TaxID=2992127 RepID=UPI0022588B59|nr:carboxymuconolactone decarboxylase family protein [Dyella subtropica]